MSTYSPSPLRSSIETTLPSSAFAQLPILLALIVFVPVVLTTLTGRLLGPLNAFFVTAFPAFHFLLYAIWNFSLIAAGYLVFRRRGITWRDVGFTNFRVRDQIWGVVAMLFGLFFIFPIANHLSTILGTGALQTKGFALVGPLAILSAILFPALLVPFAEEIIFRGFLLNLLRVKIGNLWAVGLIGIIAFTVIHIAFFGWSGMLLYIVLWTPLPVGLYLWRDSIYPTLSMHALNNLFAYVVFPMLSR
jgi:uncharacterized protein